MIRTRREMVNVEDAAKVVWKGHKKYWTIASKNARERVSTDDNLHSRPGRCLEEIYTPISLLRLKLGELSHRDKKSRAILSEFDFTPLRDKMIVDVNKKSRTRIRKLEEKIAQIKEYEEDSITLIKQTIL